MRQSLSVLSTVFHLALPPVLIHLLIRWGYDTRAFLIQSVVGVLVMLATYLASDPQANVNWAFGLNAQQEVVHPLLYLAFACAALIAAVYWPSHLVFKRFFVSDCSPP